MVKTSKKKKKKNSLDRRKLESGVCRLLLRLPFNSQYVPFKLGTYLMSRPALRLPLGPAKGETEGQSRPPSFKSRPRE